MKHSRIAVRMALAGFLLLLPDPARAQTPMPPGNSAFVPCDGKAQGDLRLFRDLAARERWAEAYRLAAASLAASRAASTEPVVEDPDEPGLCRGLLEAFLASFRRLPPRGAAGIRALADVPAAPAFARAASLADPSALLSCAREHPFSEFRREALLLAADRWLEAGNFLEAEGCLETAGREDGADPGEAVAKRLAFLRSRLEPVSSALPEGARRICFLAESRRTGTDECEVESFGAPPAAEHSSRQPCLLLSLRGEILGFSPRTGALLRWSPRILFEASAASRAARGSQGGWPLRTGVFATRQILREDDTGFALVYSREAHSDAVFLLTLAAFRQVGPSSPGRILWTKLGTEIVKGLALAFHTQPASRGGSVWIGLWESDRNSSRILLARLDGATGRTLWTRPVCIPESAPPGRGREPPPDHGELVLCAGLAVLQTNAGVVAAFDAMEGRLIWLAQYPRMPGAFTKRTVRRVENYLIPETETFPLYFSPPVRVGDFIAFAPWDTRCVFAAPLRGGPLVLAWNAGVPAVVTTGETNLAALVGSLGSLLILGLQDRFLALDADHRWSPAWILPGKSTGIGEFLGVPCGPGAPGLFPTTRGIWAVDWRTGVLQEGEEARHLFGGMGTDRVRLHAEGEHVVALLDDRALLFRLE